MMPASSSALDEVTVLMSKPVPGATMSLSKSPVDQLAQATPELLIRSLRRATDK